LHLKCQNDSFPTAQLKHQAKLSYYSKALDFSANHFLGKNSLRVNAKHGSVGRSSSPNIIGVNQLLYAALIISFPSEYIGLNVLIKLLKIILCLFFKKFKTKK
jgi:hypothetical protein